MCALNEQECGALIEAVELRDRLNDMQQKVIYFQGCFGNISNLKKIGIL